MGEQNGKQKKYILLAGALVLLAIIGLSYWWFSSSDRTGGGADSIFGFGGFGEPPPANSTDKTRNQGEMPEVPTIGESSSQGEWATQFVRLSDFPVAGMGISESSGALRFVEREKGNIYEVRGLDKSTVRRITNTTILAVQEAFFGDGGSTVVLRHLDDKFGGIGKTIKTFAGRIFPSDSEDTAGSVEGAYLPNDISEISLSPSGSSMVMVIPTADGSSIRVSDVLERNPKEVIRDPIREWIPYISNDGSIFLASKATYDAPGYLFEIDKSTKRYRKIVGGKIGMTALPSPDGKKALVSENMNNSVTMSIAGVHRTEQESVISETLPVSLSSVSQKCVWTKNGLRAYCAAFVQLPQGTKFPDDWYQGVVSTDDTFWRIDATTGETELIGEPFTSTGKVFDAINLVISDDESTLYFINKQDGILWGMRIPHTTQASGTGTDTEEMAPPTEDELRDIKGSTP